MKQINLNDIDSILNEISTSDVIDLNDDETASYTDALNEERSIILNNRSFQCV